MASYSVPTHAIRVAIADSDEQSRTSLQTLVVSQPDLQLTAAAVTPDAMAMVERDRPDILLWSSGFQLPETLSILERIYASKASVKVILLTESEQQDFFVRAVRLGCRGILNKSSSSDLLIKCVRKVHEGELWLDHVTTARVLQQFTEEQAPFSRPKDRDTKGAPLSPREREIVVLVTRGFKNKELADKLLISEQTVKNHLHNIFDKLGVSDRLELALYAIHNRLFEITSSK
ncbi:MAG: response regulator transcription factor [Acidobacteriota bacterium]|nr:response regulator transcription factor [Acidobacteriota bacterium]